MQETDIVQVGIDGRVQRVARKAAIRRQLVTTLLQGAAGNGAGVAGENGSESSGRGFVSGVRLMTVGEVAKVLRVCTATVYAMVEQGELDHGRMSNAIRVLVPKSQLR